MIHRIKELVEIGDITVRVERGVCNQCFFYNENIVERCRVCAGLDCSKFNRPDKKDVIYREVNKNSDN